jgi:ABC-type spermidine/putrescine transport system permease subunit I
VTIDVGRWAPAAPRRVFRLGRHALALPSIGWTTLFFLAPLGLLLVYSFGSTNVLTFQVQFGWTTSNYHDIFQTLYLKTILRSLELSLGATIACLLIGFPVAYTIARVRSRWQTVLLVMVMVPFWTSFVVRTYGIYNLISDSGPLGGLNMLFTPLGVGIGIVYTYLPLMILPLFVALERMDPALIDAAQDLGAPPWRVFRRVVLPLARPGIIAGCILVGVPATGEYVIPQILGGGKTLMFGNVVSDQFLNVGDYPFGAALAVAFTALLMVVLVVLRSRAREEEVALS